MPSPFFSQLSIVPLVLGLSWGGVAFGALAPWQASAQEAIDTDLADSEPSNPVTIGPGGRIVRESPSETDAEGDSIIHLHGLWESRYVSEGRDNLDGANLISTFSEFSYGPLTFVPWYAWSPDSNYSELNLSLVAGTNLGEHFELYAGYTHLQFFSDDLHDNEIGMGLIYTGLEILDLGADGYRSFDADGSFFELFATREFELAESLRLSPYALIGFNAGYVPDGHDGANNVAIGMDAACRLNRRIEVNGFANYNWAIDRDAGRNPGDESLKSFFWAGVGVRIDF